ncbi:MAG: molybdenum cofactor guanylyltransferase MobA [Geminicoccaceae bacterium]|nr:molybdenum cofactor guanylyltransferase MobA [Geminicoccaceae bacterium]MCX8101551.1 molybdenum cofactor guanylyltransferase MobA [Geminicoccaceae bacterium]MDW8369138.1 molybdenum cofactor guanylyltransferase MobA [Geminicoccaceae bacterium]
MSPPVLGVILAGGLARRMGGGDKALLPLGAGTLLDAVIERARPQVRALLLNANGDPARFRHFGLEVVADPVPGFPGPLAGVLAGMEAAARRDPPLPWVASLAADTPFFPIDLVGRLLAAVEREGAELACAASGGRTHPVFGLWPTRLAVELRRALVEEGLRKIDAWTARYRLAVVDWPADPFDPFFNVNTPEELQEAARLLAGG